MILGSLGVIIGGGSVGVVGGSGATTSGGEGRESGISGSPSPMRHLLRNQYMPQAEVIIVTRMKGISVKQLPIKLHTESSETELEEDE